MSWLEMNRELVGRQVAGIRQKSVFSSDWQATNSRVFQGSVLGHQMFILYINDLEGGPKCIIS